MIEGNAPVEEKFKLIKSVGFQGVEINAPGGFDRDEVMKACDKTGIAVHGVCDSVHWKDCLSDPDAAVRARGVVGLKAALDDAQVMKASTVLLVPGRVTKEISYDDVWKRSREEIINVIPYAQEKNVKIAIEVVWNDFLTKPQQFVDYVDSFKTPTVGAYMDIGNVVKWSPPAEWVRALGPRILKLHIKGYSHQKKWVDIGEGDENWADVRQALAEAHYNGWATAEVKGGGEKELRDISERMNKVLGLA
jgi:hexulose-6-phosphate isomerase